MIHTITLIILGCLIIANLVVLINVSNNPMYNAMDKYNQPDKVIGFDWGLVDRLEERLAIVEVDTAEVLRSLREVVEDIQERLTILEDSYKYHIQSTDELKPKA